MAEEPTEEPKRYPWYSLDPRSLKRSRLLWIVLLALGFWQLQLAPVWEFLWYHGVPSTIVRLVHVREVSPEARQWFEGREIRVYQLPHLPEGKADRVADLTRQVLDELGLDFAVEALPMPERVLAAYEGCLREEEVFGDEIVGLDLDRLQEELIAARGQDRYADVVVVDAQFGEYAGGSASTFTGVAVISADAVSDQLVKHEACHLMGYAMHDMLPLFVFGYGWEGWPWDRDSLMIGLSGNEEMLPRTRGALKAYWRGIETRTGEQYFR